MAKALVQIIGAGVGCWYLVQVAGWGVCGTYFGIVVAAGFIAELIDLIAELIDRD